MRKRGKVFISYRRDGGAELARSIREALQKRGFIVFMDVEDLRGGPFNTSLYQEIEAATDVVVVLTPGSLDRCFDNLGDWLRLELAHALKQKKNVVPVLHRSFQWPDRPLPDDLSALPEQNALSSSHDYFEASMDRLAGKLLAGWPHRRVKRRRVLITVFGTGLVAAMIGLVWWWQIGSNSNAPRPSASDSAPSAQSSTELDRHGLVGAWSWSQSTTSKPTGSVDTISFAPNGSGVYDREGQTCYEFKYTLSGNILTMTADRDHECGRGQVDSFRITVEKQTLTMTHIPSGMRTTWQRSK